MYVREQINGTTPQDIKKLNDNIQNIWYKVFGDISYEDIESGLKNRVNTQWLPVQGEGNLDNSHPLYIRFYIPPNCNKIKNTSFNVITSRYRMDSDVTKSDPQKITTQATTSGFNEEETFTSAETVNVAISSSTETVGVASVTGGSHTAQVKSWGASGKQNAPDYYLENGYLKHLEGDTLYTAYESGSADFLISRVKKYTFINQPDDFAWGVDMRGMQHTHEIKPHSHNISLKPHTHSFAIDKHQHKLQLPPHVHTVDITATVHEHSHPLNEGIKESEITPSGICIYVNDSKISNELNGDNQTINDLNITDLLKIGSWNVIKITSNSVSRITLYGTIELIIK